MFRNFFPKIAPFMGNVEKYGGDRGTTNDVTTCACAVHAVLARPHARMRVHTLTLPGTHMNARTHGPMSNTAFPRQQ